MATENTLWLPPLSSKSQRELDSFQKKRRPKWTGFAHKTLWDWLQLLIIPVVLAAAVAWFNFTQTQISFESSQNQHNTDVLLALDQQQQVALATYQKDISDLLLTQQLGSSRAGDEVRVVARARTLNTLEILDPKRKRFLTQFLYEAQLITGGSPIISLMNANLSRVDLTEANLSAANLSGVNLTGAYLVGTHLEGAHLRGANLKGADLRGVHLEGADLSEADLSEADLSEADLRGANVTTEQLDTTKSLAGTVVPDGSKHP